MNPTFGSLFAGVGGFDLGFEAAGYDCKFQVEWDKHCQQVLAHRWPDVPRWGDVSEVNGADKAHYPWVVDGVQHQLMWGDSEIIYICGRPGNIYSMFEWRCHKGCCRHDKGE